MTESIISLSEFRAEARRLLDRMQEEPGVLVLTQNGRARAVVQDYAHYQEQQNALVMLKLMVQGEADVGAGWSRSSVPWASNSTGSSSSARGGWSTGSSRNARW